jgi:hypothetical protein
MANFKAIRRPSPDELARKFGLSDQPLLTLCAYDGKPKETNLNKIVEFFLTARTPTEAKAIIFLKPILEETTGKKIVFSAYEWVTFSLPGGSYTPDWSFRMDDGSWVRVEIKASKMQPGYKDARSKLRATASLNPWDTFYEFRPRTKAEGGGWELELIKVDQSWLVNLSQAFSQWQQDLGNE